MDRYRIECYAVATLDGALLVRQHRTMQSFEVSSRSYSPAPATLVALVVEDDPRVQTAMTRELRRRGFDVLSAFHYRSAVRLLAEAVPDLVCIDVGLPDQSGYELCETIRGPLGLRTVPVVMTGDRASVQEMAYAEAAGANAFLRKPFTPRELGRAVRSLLDRSPLIAGARELERLSVHAPPITAAAPRPHASVAASVAAALPLAAMPGPHRVRRWVPPSPPPARVQA